MRRAAASTSLANSSLPADRSRTTSGYPRPGRPPAAFFPGARSARLAGATPRKQAAGIAIGEPDLRQRRNRPAHRRRGRCLRAFSLGPLGKGFLDVSARLRRRLAYPDLDGDQLGGSVAKHRDGISDHWLDGVQGAGLREHAGERGDLDRPPAARPSRHRRFDTDVSPVIATTPSRARSRAPA